MSSSFELIDTLLEHGMRNNILEGFHDLYTYADQYWYEHLRRLVELSKTHRLSIEKSQVLATALTRLTNLNDTNLIRKKHVRERKELTKNSGFDSDMRDFGITLDSRNMIMELIEYRNNDVGVDTGFNVSDSMATIHMSCEY